MMRQLALNHIFAADDIMISARFENISKDHRYFSLLSLSAAMVAVIALTAMLLIIFARQPPSMMLDFKTRRGF